MSPAGVVLATLVNGTHARCVPFSVSLSVLFVNFFFLSTFPSRRCGRGIPCRGFERPHFVRSNEPLSRGRSHG